MIDVEFRDQFHFVTDMTDYAQNSQREGRSLSRHVGIIFLSGGWGSVWGSSRRLQVFYLIPGSSVVRHMDPFQLITDPDPTPNHA